MLFRLSFYFKFKLSFQEAVVRLYTICPHCTVDMLKHSDGTTCGQRKGGILADWLPLCVQCDVQNKDSFVTLEFCNISRCLVFKLF